MLNLKLIVNTLVTKFLRAIVVHQLAAVEHRQRAVVSHALSAGFERLQAHTDYRERSAANEETKRRLEQKLDRLNAMLQPADAFGQHLKSMLDEARRISLKGLDSDDITDAIQTVMRNHDTATASEAELRLAADLATCGQIELGADPMDWPLPCDIEIGAGTIRRGIPLRTLVTRVRALHAIAANSYPTAANFAIDPIGTRAGVDLAQAELNKTLV